MSKIPRLLQKFAHHNTSRLIPPSAFEEVGQNHFLSILAYVRLGYKDSSSQGVE